MNGRTLTVWDAPGDPNGEGDIYTWSGYAEQAGVRSVLAYVDAHGERLRERYAAWIHELGETPIDGRRVVDHLTGRDGLSYWWMTLLVEKSPWKSPAIMDALRLLALEELVTAVAPTKVRLVSGNETLRRTLEDFCAATGLSFEHAPAERTKAAPPARRGLPHGARALAYLGRHWLKRSALRGAPRAGWFDGDDAVFFFSYFIHLDAASCASGHFYSRHWEGIPAMLHAAGKRTNWLQHYLQSASVPSTATALDWVQKFDQRPREEGFHTFLDAFLSPRVMRRALASWSRLRRAAGRLRNLERAFTPAGSRMSLWFFMRDDWERSTIGVIAMENALFAALIDEAMRTLPRQRLGVFLNENQAWERAFAHFWRRHGHERLIGVSHSTVRFWDLRYMIDRRTIDDRGPNAIPQADVIALNGPAAVEQFRAMGFPTERMVATEAQRYGYLERQASDRQSKVSTGGATRLLVLGDYHADGTTKMLRLLESAAPLVRSTVRYTVKPHPNFMVKASDYPSLQLEIVTENLGKILGDFDVAYASNNTSAAVDAFFIGMPLIVILDDEELNFSPLRGEPRVPFVSSAEDLAAAIDGLAAPAAGESKGVPFFYLDSTLPRWRGLLTHAQAKPDRA